MFTITRRIPFGDCDPAGAVYTPRIAHYVVEASLAFHSHILGAPAPRSLFALGILPPARNLNIDFLAPLDYDDEIAIGVAVSAIGRTSFTCLVQADKPGGVTAFRASFTQVCVDAATKRPQPIPQVLLAALQGHMAP